MNVNDELAEKNRTSIWQNSIFRKAVIVFGILLIGFLLGFVPMWLTARERAAQLTETQNNLKRADLENQLAAAALDARRGEWEQARQSTSSFFTNLREETDRPLNSPFTATQKDRFKLLFGQRDEIITLLARSDPAAADRLLEIYLSFRQPSNSVLPSASPAASVSPH